MARKKRSYRRYSRGMSKKSILNDAIVPAGLSYIQYSYGFPNGRLYYGIGGLLAGWFFKMPSLMAFGASNLGAYAAIQKPLDEFMGGFY